MRGGVKCAYKSTRVRCEWRQLAAKVQTGIHVECSIRVINLQTFLLYVFDTWGETVLPFQSLVKGVASVRLFVVAPRRLGFAKHCFALHGHASQFLKHQQSKWRQSVDFVFVDNKWSNIPSFRRSFRAVHTFVFGAPCTVLFVHISYHK